MRALGADVELLDAVVAPGTVTPTDIDAMRARAADLAQQSGHYFTDQFNHPYVVAGLPDGLGMEILNQSAHLPVTAFCTGIGSGASLLGVAAATHRRDPRPRIV